MTRTEFARTVRTLGYAAAEYLASELGVCRALVELWEKEI